MWATSFRIEDEGGLLTATYPDGRTQAVRWDELDRVEIHTNDSGPWGADVWWVLVGSGGSCSYPQGAIGEDELLPRFQALEGFDNEPLIAAMTCTGNQVFVCWRRASTA